MIKLYFTKTSVDCFPYKEPEFMNSVRELFYGSNQNKYELVDGPKEADLIIFFEAKCYKYKEYVKILKSHPCMQQFPEKCYVVNQDTHFMPFLPGSYIALEKKFNDPSKYTSSIYLFPVNLAIDRYIKSKENITPSYLCSFRGTLSSPIRKEICDIENRFNKPVLFVQLPDEKFFNHTKEEEEDYVKSIVKAKFVLCPKGLGCNTHRLYETMKLGRVPVIIADKWQPSEGPNWNEISIRVREKDIKKLPEILDAYEPHFEEMSQTVKETWERYFAKPNRLVWILDCLWNIHLMNKVDIRKDMHRWEQTSYYWPYGLHPLQRVSYRIKREGFKNSIKYYLDKIIQKVKVS